MLNRPSAVAKTTNPRSKLLPSQAATPSDGSVAISSGNSAQCTAHSKRSEGADAVEQAAMA